MWRKLIVLSITIIFFADLHAILLLFCTGWSLLTIQQQESHQTDYEDEIVPDFNK